MRRLAKKRPLPGKAIERSSAGCSLRVVKVNEWKSNHRAQKSNFKSYFLKTGSTLLVLFQLIKRIIYE